VKKRFLVLSILVVCALLAATTLVSGAAVPGQNAATDGISDLSQSPQLEIAYLPPPPALTVTKTVVDPTGGLALIGQTIVYDITIQNTGGALIPHLPFVDAYDGPCFDWLDATPPPDMPQVTGGVWTDLGALDLGEIHQVQVRLVAQAPCMAAENRAWVSLAFDDYGRPVPPADDQATVRIVAGLYMYLPNVMTKPAYQR